MNAMELMMKQLGIDPAAMKENAEKIGVLVGNISERLTNLEAQNARIEAKLDALMGDTAAPPRIAAITQQHEKV